MSLLRKKMLRDLSIRRFASTTKESYLRAVSLHENGDNEKKSEAHLSLIGIF